MTRKIDLSGRRFDKLVCIADVGQDRHGSRLWLCLCDCGNHIVKRAGVFATVNQRQMACKACGDKAKAAAHLKHGESRIPLYHAWINMRRRCQNPENPKNKYWAGKGIKVTQEWSDYETFRDWALSAGYQEGLAIDRVNPDGDYEPSNCRWITVSENTIVSLNRRYGR